MSPVLLDPTGRSEEIETRLADRAVGSLDGCNVGLLHSTKFNSDRLLDGLAELLQERWAIKRIVRQRKPTFARPVPNDMAEALAKECDVVITGIGD